MLNINDFEVLGPDDSNGKYTLKYNDIYIHLHKDKFKNKRIMEAIEIVEGMILQAENKVRKEIAAKLLCTQMETLIQEPQDDPEPIC